MKKISFIIYFALSMFINKSFVFAMDLSSVLAEARHAIGQGMNVITHLECMVDKIPDEQDDDEELASFLAGVIKLVQSGYDLANIAIKNIAIICESVIDRLGVEPRGSGVSLRVVRAKLHVRVKGFEKARLLSSKCISSLFDIEKLMPKLESGKIEEEDRVKLKEAVACLRKSSCKLFKKIETAFNIVKDMFGQEGGSREDAFREMSAKLSSLELG